MSMESQPSIEDRFKSTLSMDSAEQPEAEAMEAEQPEMDAQTVEQTTETDVLDLESESEADAEVLEDQAEEAEDDLEDEESVEIEVSDIDLEATYTIDGVEMTGQELKDGYLRQSDYTRKTQELSQQREIVEQSEQQAKQNMELGVTALGMLTSDIDAQLQRYAQVNWQELATQADPQEYNRMQAEMQALQMKKQQLGQQAQALFQTYNQQQEQVKAEQAHQAAETLRSNIPNWNNAMYSELQKFGVEIGFTEQEMMDSTDARLFMLLHKAKQADSAKKVATKKRVKASPKRSLKPSSPQEVTQTQRQKQAHQNLKKTGKVDDAAAAFKARLSR